MQRTFVPDFVRFLQANVISHVDQPFLQMVQLLSRLKVAGGNSQFGIDEAAQVLVVNARNATIT